MSKKTIELISSYFATKPINKAWLFGSYARGEQKRNSDIDILVELQKEAKMGFAFAGMVCDLEDILHKNVDLVVNGSLLPFAQETANRDKILIYERS